MNVEGVLEFGPTLVGWSEAIALRLESPLG